MYSVFGSISRLPFEDMRNNLGSGRKEYKLELFKRAIPGYKSIGIPLPNCSLKLSADNCGKRLMQEKRPKSKRGK